MIEKEKKGKFTDWKLKDWCIYACFILLSFLFLYITWASIKTSSYFNAILFFICFILLLFLCLIPIFSKPMPAIKSEYTYLRVPLPETKEKFLELVKSIGANDKNILTEVFECLNAPEYFLEKMKKAVKETDSSEDKELYEDLSAEYEEYRDYSKDTKEPFLQGALILLDYRQIIARFDWKADTETFIFLMKNLNVVNANGLIIDEDIFPEYEEVGQCCGRLDKFWEKSGYHTVVIDNDSDEYIVGIQKNLE